MSRFRIERAITIVFAYFLLALGILLLSGIVRAILHINIEVSLAFAAIVGLVVAKLMWLPLRDGTFRLSTTEICFGLLLVGVLVRVLYVSNLGGIATFGNGDSGLQLQRLKSFEVRRANQYHGFISLYAFVIWIKRVFPLNDFVAVATSLYVGFAILMASSFIAFIRFFGGESRKQLLLTLILFLVGGVTFFVPLYFEFMAQGAFPHVFGISVFFATVLSFAYFSDYKFRICVLLIGTFFIRYTYGLNIADLIALCSVICTIELSKSLRWKNSLYRFAPLILLLSSAYCYYKLWIPLHLGGAATKIPLPLLYSSFAVGIIAFVIFLRSENYDASKSARLVLFTALYAGVLILVYFVFVLFGVKPRYYVYKYPIYGAFLFILVALGVFGHVLTHSKLPGTVRVKIAALLFISLLLSGITFWPYMKDAYIRKKDKLVSMKEWNAIELVLQTTGNKFGGFFTWNWPRYWFVNTAFGHKVGFPSFLEGKVKLDPGYCIFWQGSPQDEQKLSTIMHIKKGRADDVLRNFLREKKKNVGTVLDVQLGEFSGSRLGSYCLKK